MGAQLTLRRKVLFHTLRKLVVVVAQHVAYKHRADNAHYNKDKHNEDEYYLKIKSSLHNVPLLNVVTYTALGDKVFGVRGVFFKLFAKAGNGNVNRVNVTEKSVVAPNLAKQFFS